MTVRSSGSWTGAEWDEETAENAFILAMVKLARFYGTMPGLKSRF